MKPDSPLQRNALCYCGSGKRYKECHGALDPGRSARDLPASPIDSTAAEEHFRRGNALRRSGETAAAIAEYRESLRRGPSNPAVLNNLGLALEAARESDEAQACYREALVADPHNAAALGNLAKILFEREHFAECAATYDRLVAIASDLPAAVWVNRAIAHQQLGNSAVAEASFGEAARLAPNDCATQLNVGTALIALKRHADAEPAWSRVLAVDPDNLYALSMLAHGRQHLCDWRGLSEIFARIERLLASDEAPADRAGRHANPFPLLSMPMTLSALLRASTDRATTIGTDPPTLRPGVALRHRERLRVGFASTDFHDHPMAHLCMEFWERMDRKRIEAFAYALLPPDPGAIGARIRASFEHFADVSTETTVAVAKHIRSDHIHILFDLNGYTTNARERIFALRAAPVQVNCIGFPGTLGAPWYDYIYTDRFALPESLQRYYTERALYMPHTTFPSDTTRLPAGAPPTRAALGLPERGFVFCCFNNAYKILPEVFALWMRLLEAVPGSVLWLLETLAEAKANLRREAGQAGVDPQRLIFAPRVPIGEHVARNAAADLFLDTYPYGAHTTANDALLAGLPVLTCIGETLASRIAGSQLHAVGLPELVTERFADYERLALALATEPALLQRYRDRLAANRSRAPLFDMTAYASDFADAMERIWREHRNSEEAG